MEDALACVGSAPVAVRMTVVVTGLDEVQFVVSRSIIRERGGTRGGAGTIAVVGPVVRLIQRAVAVPDEVVRIAKPRRVDAHVAARLIDGVVIGIRRGIG